jgi:Domain of unknown function (DUF4440)
LLATDEQTEKRRGVMNDQTEELNKLMEDWASAELRGDTTFLKSFLADDFVGVGPYGFLLTKDEWLERHESRKLRYESSGWTKLGCASTEMRR